MAALADVDAAVRRAAVGALAEIGRRHVLVVLGARLVDPDPAPRRRRSPGPTRG